MQMRRGDDDDDDDCIGGTSADCVEAAVGSKSLMTRSVPKFEYVVRTLGCAYLWAFAGPSAKALGYLDCSNR